MKRGTFNLFGNVAIVISLCEINLNLFFFVSRLAVRECVCHVFKKGLYITLVVSPWPFQCFMTLLFMSFYLMLIQT